MTNEQVKRKAFCHHIVSILQTSSVRGNVARSHPARICKVADEIRLDNVQHYVPLGPVCKCAIWRMSFRSTCSKCNQSVHVKLFSELSHRKQLWLDITANFGLSPPNFFLIFQVFYVYQKYCPFYLCLWNLTCMVFLCPKYLRKCCNYGSTNVAIKCIPMFSFIPYITLSHFLHLQSPQKRIFPQGIIMNLILYFD